MINGQHGREHIRRMAVLTDIGRLNVCLILASCVRAVVAAEAVASNIHVIEIRWQPANRAVTVIAIVAACDMTLVFAAGGNTVVAGAAGAKDLGVVDNHDGHENVGRMAVFADICRLRVGYAFPCCITAVVAIYAIGGNRGVIEGCRQPGSCRVAVIAGIAAGDVCGMLAGGNDAIMTVSTTAKYLRVIDSHHRRKYVGRMAVLTHICCLYVRRIFAGRIRAVMTGRTIAGDIQVIEICWQPADRTMTVSAIVAADDMTLVLAGSDHAIVAGPTGTKDLVVIDAHHRCK